MSNLDPAEIDKFQSLANTWWDSQGPLHTLHEINPVRLHYINEKVPGGLCGKRVLDVGCGAGILSESMARQGAQVLGIDLAEDALRAGKQHAAEQGVEIQYRSVAVEDLAAAEPESFDVVTCMEMLEHVPDPAAIIAACAKLVKAGGDAFFSTLNRNPKSYLYAIVGAEYLLGLLPRGTHDYEKFLRPSELLDMVRDGGLRLRDLQGMHYDPWRRTARLTGDVSVNYLCHCQKPG
ncbi:bifunctional 2-polyprenyl-6-hydroxyphenol methylase/3-demethylubiquinol 3-O-methyltransferase UbiG [Acidithiobacillus sp. AMEEHan]|uniref:bifunctional 2-polyprenyl-6-hydroxyphenol methylase/3-demethylubiquinol 3-O-methyltransferase UbiG n=1 Tax=Acidithiobacillus sp. AMEEHan TaxID=2994951 RepID=UPI0027E47058|nr:bifunctional 2-polyprenyl-6-hydroxyphenol methylase/3-demethylubiquinol 3-O-methyltransferase UbiG [Acidithiobacillus sp. AMEEHan]